MSIAKQLVILFLLLALFVGITIAGCPCPTTEEGGCQKYNLFLGIFPTDTYCDCAAGQVCMYRDAETDNLVECGTC
uniref:Uncharacterized protein n=1 Tax=Ditylenchus dipsaci TaxID=166011 RepID=A0A915E683_9BILA